MNKKRQIPKISIPKVRCIHCGHEWVPRIPDPVKCPNCHRIRCVESVEEGELA